MIVAASSRCFFDLPLNAALQRLVDLEYTCVEMMLHEKEGHIKPSEVQANLEQVIRICRQTHRLTPIAYSVDIEAKDDADYYSQFLACCKLAKATKVVAINVRASELGTPFNAEVERLRELTKIATDESVVVGLLTESGRMTEDPDTAVVLCNNVNNLGICLDPSHYIYGPKSGVRYDQLFKFVIHVRLRDTSKEQIQVKIGQGEVEYGRLVSQLTRCNYDRALCVDIKSMPDVDQAAEMRKMRLLLESLT